MKQYFRITSAGDIPVEVFKRLSLEAKRHKSKDVCIQLMRRREKITTEMHRYYRKVVLPAVWGHYVEVGYDVTKDQVHRNLKEIYGPEEDIGIQEPMFRKKESMAEYTKEESHEFVEAIKRDFAAHVYIPDPNEIPIEAYG